MSKLSNLHCEYQELIHQDAAGCWICLEADTRLGKIHATSLSEFLEHSSYSPHSGSGSLKIENCPPSYCKWNSEIELLPHKIENLVKENPLGAKSNSKNTPVVLATAGENYREKQIIGMSDIIKDAIGIMVDSKRDQPSGS